MCSRSRRMCSRRRARCCRCSSILTGRCSSAACSFSSSSISRSSCSCSARRSPLTQCTVLRAACCLRNKRLLCTTPRARVRSARISTGLRRPSLTARIVRQSSPRLSRTRARSTSAHCARSSVARSSRWRRYLGRMLVPGVVWYQRDAVHVPDHTIGSLAVRVKALAITSSVTQGAKKQYTASGRSCSRQRSARPREDRCTRIRMRSV